MKKASKIVLTTALVAVLCPAAQAGVVYNWAPEAANAYSSSGRIDLDPAAWASGAIGYYVSGYAMPSVPGGFLCPRPNPPTPDQCADPDAKVLSFSFRVDDGGFVLSTRNIPPYISGRFGLSVAQNGTLSGGIDMRNGTIDSGLRLGGGDTWAANFIHGDSNSTCSGNGGCSVIGRWVLDETTVTSRVSEPGMLALMALGILGAVTPMLGRRRRVQCP